MARRDALSARRVGQAAGETAALFAYGTLLFEAVLEVVIGRRVPGRAASLAGYRRSRLLGRVYPGLVEAEGAVTEGLLYAGLDEADLADLDRFEGSLYERRRVAVDVPGTVPAPAFTYVIAPAFRALVTPEPWDPARFVEQLPAYLAACRSSPAGPAPTG